MAKLPIVIAKHLAQSLGGTVIVAFLSLILLFSYPSLAAKQALPENQGLFLVATEQLEGTSFQEAVILITHNSERGATGLTINRPTNIPLKEAFPHSKQFTQQHDPLYLGGPVSANAIFVLLRTDQPSQHMHHIAKDIYFSTAKNAFINPINGTSRTYAGYAGWGPGQLKVEIDRGDWILLHTEPGIIFEKTPRELWQRLSKRWSGQWL